MPPCTLILSEDAVISTPHWLVVSNARLTGTLKKPRAGGLKSLSTEGDLEKNKTKSGVFPYRGPALQTWELSLITAHRHTQLPVLQWRSVKSQSKLTA